VSRARITCREIDTREPDTSISMIYSSRLLHTLRDHTNEYTNVS